MRVKVLKPFRYGGKTYQLGQEVELPEAYVPEAERRGLAKRVQTQTELPEPIEPLELEAPEEELPVITSDQATEPGLRRMRARVIRVERTTGLRGTDQVHLVLRPLDRPDWSDQHEWFQLSKSKDSAYVQLSDQLVRLGAVAKGGSLREIQGKAFEWEEREGVGRSRSAKWWPIRLEE